MNNLRGLRIVPSKGDKCGNRCSQDSSNTPLPTPRTSIVRSLVRVRIFRMLGTCYQLPASCSIMAAPKKRQLQLSCMMPRRTRAVTCGSKTSHRNLAPQVARIVEACSDSLEQDPEKKEEWRPRKERYLRHLRENPDQSVYLVSAADKLDNARATLADWLEGVQVWNRFKVGREETLWLYDELVVTYEAGPPDKRRQPIVREIRRDRR